MAVAALIGAITGKLRADEQERKYNERLKFESLVRRNSPWTGREGTYYQKPDSTGTIMQGAVGGMSMYGSNQDMFKNMFAENNSENAYDDKIASSGSSSFVETDIPEDGQSPTGKAYYSNQMNLAPTPAQIEMNNRQQVEIEQRQRERAERNSVPLTRYPDNNFPENRNRQQAKSKIDEIVDALRGK